MTCIELLPGMMVRMMGGTDGRWGGDGPVVVLLHGFGASGDDLVPLAEALALPATFRYVFPQGPVSLGFDSGAGEARAWWWLDAGEFQRAIEGGDIVGMMDAIPDGLKQARRAILSLLSYIHRTLSVPYEHIVLGGFSQGGILALDASLNTEAPLGAVVLLSAAVASRQEWLHALPVLPKVPVFQSHGKADPVLPFEVALELNRMLGTANFEVEWVPFNGGHSIPAEVLVALRAFLIRVEEVSNRISPSHGT
ncbi:MAG: phospholipase [Myxococcales bacterium]|nr:phospholipase [Myxococcales bacterium]MCB9708658.1 phospholipase [Myxococcales bacterium]